MATADAGDAGAARLDPTFFDPCVGDSPRDPVFTWKNPDDARVRIDVLRQIVSDAASQESDSLIVAVDDTIVAHKCFAASAKPATVQSITKSVVSLAIGMLVGEGKISSLDTPVSTFFPEWTDGNRAQVTVRHLLTQTSGIVDEVTDAGASPLFSAPDALAYARTQEPKYAPGSTFNYCNTGVMLLGGVASIAAGEDVGVYIEKHLFAPLGITDATWSRDKARNAMTPGGLSMQPLDLLRLARFAREQGVWQGQRLVPERWFTLTTAPQAVVEYPCYGYLWWMIRDHCASDKGLSGVAGPLQGFYADGYGGNVAAVVPSSHVLGVRMKVPTSSDPAVVRATNFDALTHELAGLAP